MREFPKVCAFGLRGAAGLAAILFLLSTAVGQSTTKDNPKAHDSKNAVTALEVVVTGGTKNVPVDNASVYLRWDEPQNWGHPKEMEFDLKTNLEGIAKVKDVPRIRIIIQVVKTGWKPFGQYYDLGKEADKDQQRIEIRMEKPPHWY